MLIFRGSSKHLGSNQSEWRHKRNRFQTSLNFKLLPVNELLYLVHHDAWPLWSTIVMSDMTWFVSIWFGSIQYLKDTVKHWIARHWATYSLCHLWCQVGSSKLVARAELVTCIYMGHYSNGRDSDCIKKPREFNIYIDIYTLMILKEKSVESPVLKDPSISFKF